MSSPLPNTLNGATRVHFIVGDPIAQVKSPSGVSQAFGERGHNALVMPAHVAPANLADWLAGVSLANNVDGIIVTIPHKFACFDLCATTSDRASFLKTVNTMRRNPDETWHGDMFDGMGFCAAMQGNEDKEDSGCQIEGQRALLVGAGGAGSAIAYSLVMGGVGELAIHDEDVARRTTLVDRLASLNRCKVTHAITHDGAGGMVSPAGFDIALNATPMGMKAGDPFPLDVAQINSSMFVGCVITAPAVSPLVQAARDKGCRTMTGADMFGRVRDLMVDFLLKA
jgi:shikimate dehydrogenase